MSECDREALTMRWLWPVRIFIENSFWEGFNKIKDHQCEITGFLKMSMLKWFVWYFRKLRYCKQTLPH